MEKRMISRMPNTPHIHTPRITPVKKKMLAVAAVTLIMCVISHMGEDGDSFAKGVIVRPESGEGSVSINVRAAEDKHNGRDCDFDIVVSPKKFTKEQAFENFAKAEEYLINNMAGENESFDNISGDLKLVTSISEYNVTIDWYSSDYELVGYDGTVSTGKVSDSGADVKLTAVMKCGEHEAERVFDIKVVNPELTGGDKFANDVYEAVSKALKNNEYEEQINLPSDINGQKIIYSEKQESNVPIIMTCGILGAFAVVVSEKESKRKAEKFRIKQMQYSYSEVVSKLTLLIGAGMSVRRAWEKIALDYEKKRDKNINFAYEEMLVTLRGLQSGVPEKTAYSEFGRRCGTKEYRKLGTLLEQNVRKGTKGLTELLEQESSEAFEQRKNLARQLGEEAGTKLLLPMLLMLVIVMVIVMVPAVMSFQI